MSSINDFASKVEMGFNFAGSLPVVAIFSGALRVSAGKIQVVAAVIIGVLAYLASCVAKEPGFDTTVSLAFEHVGHGVLNIVKGCGEELLGLTIVGSLCLFFYELSRGHNRFTPMIFPYKKPTYVQSLSQR